MPVLVRSQEAPGAWAPPAAKPLDEASWQAWVVKGREQERRSSATRIEAVKWASIAVLLAIAVTWSHFAPFEVAARFLVIAGAMVAMFQVFRAKRYAMAFAFGVLVLLFNPIAPAFRFSGDWQRSVVAVSVLPFVASPAWRNLKDKTQ